MRMAHGMRVDPDAVRQADVGEAWVISNGRSLHTSVIPPRHDAALLDAAEALLRARPAESDPTDTSGPGARRESEEIAEQPPAPSFLDELDDPTAET
jgi:hypothetical protein